MTEKDTENVVNLKDYKDKIIKKLSENSYNGEAYEDYDDELFDIIRIELTDEAINTQLAEVFPEGVPEELQGIKFFLIGVLPGDEESEIYIEDDEDFSIEDDLNSQIDELLEVLEEKEMIIESLMQEIKILNKDKRKLEKTNKTTKAAKPKGKEDEPK